MTECERLIANGAFTRDFFKPEVRCDFMVDEKRKKLWAIQLDMLRLFQSVCQRHNLTYYAIGGTLLGALRHGGFIPWDDDIDIGMPREDYEKFVGLGKEFVHPYFLQVPGKDHDFCYSFTKIRNSNTSQISKLFIHKEFNQGVQIDVFPLDVWDVGRGRSAYARIDELNIDNSNYLRQGCPNPDDAMRKRMMCWSGRSWHENVAEIDKLAKQFQGTQADRMTFAVCTIYKYEKVLFYRDWYGKGRSVLFEGFRITIPESAEEILKMQYGDWQKFPPVEERGSWHGNEIFDADVPFAEYLKKAQ